MSSSTNIVADFYCVSHISAATIPSSRLSDILTRMHQGRPLTKHSLDFLQQQNLPGLYRLACGEITHDEYITGLDPASLSSHLAAKATNEAKETERQALAAHYQVRKTNHPSGRRAKETDRETEREQRRKREREANEADEAARRMRRAEWKVQRERNCELAVAAYRTCAITSGYTELTALDIARYFHLEHVAAATIPPMSDLLTGLFQGRPLTEDEFTFLRQNPPNELYQLAFGKLSIDEYISLASAAKAEVLARKARVEAIEAARIAREKDPEYIAMIQTQALYKKYGISLIDESLRPRMTKLLQQIDAGNRLPNEELMWLSTKAKKHFTVELRNVYHRLEADFHTDQYRRTQDPWNVVNASGHYRKCDRPTTALELIDSVPRDRIKQPKIRAAIFTTRGGVMRDLGQRSVAIELGETAHALIPEDYRPCTLLGAVNMELQHFEKGHKWYEKARELGAPGQGIDSELRSIFQRLDPVGREAMKNFLLAEDPHRYQWLNGNRSLIAK
ncbi:MAG: hypothetical protein IPL05_02170 [Betaproteobacteria bacterium]|nr:hypothetical protein [Betaproteobacteria bacterium]